MKSVLLLIVMGAASLALAAPTLGPSDDTTTTTVATNEAPGAIDHASNNLQQLVGSVGRLMASPQGGGSSAPQGLNPVVMRQVIESVVNKVLAKGGCPKGFTREMCNQPATFYVWLRELRDQALYKEIQQHTKVELAKALAKYNSIVAQFQNQQARINLLKHRLQMQQNLEQQAAVVANQAGTVLTQDQDNEQKLLANNRIARNHDNNNLLATNTNSQKANHSKKHARSSSPIKHHRAKIVTTSKASAD